MASRPEDDLPDSILLNAFTGIKNTVAAERLQQTELEAAVNIDLDDVGQPRRRRGQTQVAAGSWHSAWRHRETAYAVKDGELGVLYPDYSHAPLADVGADPLDYTEVADVIYYSSRSVSGKIVEGVAVPWGERAAEGGTWLSPVVRPTETLGAISGKLVAAPPLATSIEAFNGRIAMANGPYLWFTELYLYDLVDKTRNFFQFEADITMLAAVDSGLFVGTETDLYFLTGTLKDGYPRKDLGVPGAVPRSAVRVSAEKVHPDARSREIPVHKAVVFLSPGGICAGFNGGEVYNLTQGRVSLPPAVSAAALYREQDGVNQYVAVAQTGGAGASVRIGDYVEAEIRRAAEGG